MVAWIRVYSRVTVREHSAYIGEELRETGVVSRTELSWAKEALQWARNIFPSLPLSDPPRFTPLPPGSDTGGKRKG